MKLSAAQQAMRRACRLAKIPTHTPHDLRHRRLTLWRRVAGHLKARAGHHVCKQQRRDDIAGDRVSIHSGLPRSPSFGSGRPRRSSG
jgi:hypothetical protein